MSDVSDEFDLEAIGHLHGIAAGLFVPFAVVRLRGDSNALEQTLTVRLRSIGEDSEEREKHLRLFWSPRSVPVQPLGVQQNAVTEGAALAVACVLVWLYGGLRIRAVAAPGERFDFWTTDGEQEQGLEVSGTVTQDLESRHQEKVRQLLSNPRGMNGCVVTVSFGTQSAIFSFNRFKETGK